ncbi:hypothetical protein ILYODFUR_036149 [Ilyodon furcidens]|uniref:Uncharacterized protein n=1 Tax=Ilyodon furcidens TaxID=33524 RepID=A0ABV0UP85_9TELE
MGESQKWQGILCDISSVRTETCQVVVSTLPNLLHLPHPIIQLSTNNPSKAGLLFIYLIILGLRVGSRSTAKPYAMHFVVNFLEHSSCFITLWLFLFSALTNVVIGIQLSPFTFIFEQMGVLKHVLMQPYVVKKNLQSPILWFFVISV